MSNLNLLDDEELFSLFSDFFKDVNNIRPRGGYWTREVIIDWIEHEMDPEVQALRREQWEEEARWLDEQEALEVERREEEIEEARERFFYEMEEALA